MRYIFASSYIWIPILECKTTVCNLLIFYVRFLSFHNIYFIQKLIKTYAYKWYKQIALFWIISPKTQLLNATSRSTSVYYLCLIKSTKISSHYMQKWLTSQMYKFKIKWCTRQEGFLYFLLTPMGYILLSLLYLFEVLNILLETVE